MTDYPTMTCPKCGREETDFDGFGMLHCSECDYCTHPSISDGRCEFCSRPVDPLVGQQED